MTWLYRRGDMLLALAGPVSWLGAILYFLWVLLSSQGPWAGLAALVYCAEILFWLHILLPVGLLGWVAARQLRGLPIRRWARWGLIYYGVLPLVVLVVLVSTQGLRATGEAVRYLLRAPWLLEQLGIRR